MLFDKVVLENSEFMCLHYVLLAFGLEGFMLDRQVVQVIMYC